MKLSLKIAAISLVSTFSFNVLAAEPAKLSEADINKQMEKMADNINHQLPRKVDEIMSLLHVDYKDKVFSYFYKIDDLTQLKNPADVKANMTRVTCTSLGNMVNEHGYAYHYNYVAPNDEQIMDFTIDKKVCAEQKN